MTSLALTMIVRDESANLPTFLAHHEGLADELVIVDTGSTDNTMEIAAAAADTVVSHRWCDDFAAARNAALAAVTADWVLILDADERISHSDFDRLRAGLSPKCDRVLLQETWNYCLGTTHLEWQPLPGRYPIEEAEQTGLFVARRVGIFPRDEQITFSGRVHESVLPAAQMAQMPVESLDIPVHHYGYTLSATVNKARHARYRLLLEKKYADNPDDPSAQLELATVLLESGEATEALVYLQKLGHGVAGLRPVVRGLVLQGRLRREMGELQTARDLLDEAVRQDSGFVFGWLERIRVETQSEDWPTAQTLLAQAEAQLGALHPQLLREALLIMIKTKQLSAALTAAEQLVRFCPQWQEIQDLRARLLRLNKPAGEV